jgi:hypothetical protein
MCVRGASVLAPLMVFHSHDLLRLLSLLYLNIGLIPKSTSIYPYYYIILVKKIIFMVKVMLKTQINIITCICYLFWGQEWHCAIQKRNWDCEMLSEGAQQPWSFQLLVEPWIKWRFCFETMSCQSSVYIHASVSSMSRICNILFMDELLECSSKTSTRIRYYAT